MNVKQLKEILATYPDDYPIVIDHVEGYISPSLVQPIKIKPLDSDHPWQDYRESTKKLLPKLILRSPSTLAFEIEVKIMNIQEFLTYFINTFILSSILFFLLDFCFYLFNSWQKLSPSPQPSFYCQVKDLLWDNNNQLKLQT